MTTSKKLWENWELLRVTLAGISDAVMTTNPQACVTSLNAAAESLTGWTKDEAAGRPLEEVLRIVNEQTRATVENPVTAMIAAGKVVRLADHTLLISKDDSEHTIEGSAAPIHDAEGKLSCAVLVFRDLTEHRRLERLVAAAGDYAENIVDTVREPLIVLDADLRVRTASRSFYRTFQVSPEETQGQFIYELGDQQWDIPALRNLLEEVLPQNTKFNDFEVEHTFPTIGHRIMLLNARRIHRDSNQTELILLAIEDITKRKHVEAAVEISEVRYRRLFESAQDGILILDADTGNISDANPFIAELLGYTYAELMGKGLWQIGLFKDQKTSKIAMRELQNKHYIRYDDLPLETKAGRRVDVEFVSNVYIEGHQPVIQCNIRDVSQRKRMEDELRQFTAELSEADRRKNEFLAMLAHELRNPLAPIRNALQVMRLTGGNREAVASASAMMERQIGQMVRLVDDLLDVSRISRGKIELRKGRIDLASTVNHAVEAIRPLSDSLDQSLTVTLPPQPIYLNADPTRLAQVLGNLLNNACKFTDDGGRIELTVERSGEQAVVRVRDNGIGITAEQLPHIFELFMQVDTSLERSGSGLGIGLTLVKNLVEMHDGTVEAQSSGAGQGSEFVVRLPIMADAPTPQLEPAASEPTRKTVQRILVVDDNRDSAESLAMLLKLTGRETRTAYDGLEAVEAAATFRPEVILLDIGLPKLNGYEVTRRIRGHSWGKHMAIVALTGWGQPEDRQKSEEAGFDAHLVKPVDYAVLQDLLAGLGTG